MLRTKGLFSGGFGFLHCIKCPDSDNYRVTTVSRWINVFRKAGFVFPRGVSLITRPGNQAKVFDPVVPFVLVDVVYPHPIGDVPIVPNPDNPMEQRAKTGERDLPVWAGFRTVIPGDLGSTPANAFTPFPPEKFARFIVKYSTEFCLTRQFSRFCLHTTIHNCIILITAIWGRKSIHNIAGGVG